MGTSCFSHVKELLDEHSAAEALIILYTESEGGEANGRIAHLADVIGYTQQRISQALNSLAEKGIISRDYKKGVISLNERSKEAEEKQA